MIYDHTANTLPAALAKLDPQDSVCLIYETRAEQAAATAAFLRPGLARGEQAVLLAEAEAAEAVLQALRAEGVDTAQAQRSGALRVAGALDAPAARAFCSLAVQEALAAGFAGARFALEAEWAYGEASPALLLEHEAALRRALGDRPPGLLTLYDRSRCTAQMLLRVINAHAVVIWQGRACRNPCFIPPEQPAGPRREAQAVERLLGSLRAWEETRQALAESEELHRLTLSEISDAVFISDEDDRLVYVCPNVDVIFGHTQAEAQEMGSITALLGEGLFEPGALNGGGEIRNIERRVTDKAGRPHDLLVTVKRVSIGRGTRLYTCRDVTEQRQAQQRLAYLAYVLDNVHDAVVATDAQGVVTAWNAAAHRMYGWRAQEALGRPAHELVPTDWSAEARAEAYRTLETDGVYCAEYRQKRRDGSPIHTEGVALALRDEAGRLSGYVSVNRDIGERKKREAALRESEERYRLLVELSPLPIAVYGEGRMLFANPACGALFGASDASSLVGRPLADLFHPVLRQRVAEKAREFEEAGATHTGFESRLAFADGHTADVEVFSAPVTFQGRPARMVIARDVTQKRDDEAALRRSMRRFAAIFHASPIPISISTLADGRLLDVNPRWSELFGYAREEAVGQTSLDLGLWADPGDRRRLVEQLEQAGAVRNVEVTFQTRAGEVVHALESIERIDLEEEDQPILLSMIVDVSERRRAEAALRESEARYRELITLLPDAVVVHADGQLLYANQSAAQMFGVATTDELSGGTKWNQIVPAPGEPDRVGPLGHDFPLERREPQESSILFPDGRLRHIDSASAAIQYQGRPARLVVARDVTERRQREEALRRSEERFAKIFYEGPHAASITTAAEGRVLQANQRCLDFYGFTAEEMLGRTTVELGIWRSAEERRQAVEQMRRSGAVRNQEFTFRSRTGEERHALRFMEWLHLEDEAEPVVLSTLVDITHLKRMEEQKRQTAQRLETLAELSGALMAAGTSYQTTLDRIAERAAEVIGDCSVLALMSDDQRWLEAAAFAHRRPEARDLLQQILGGRRRPAQAGLLGRVLRTGEPLLLRELDQARLPAEVEPEYLPYLGAIGVDSALITPLLANGRAIGALGLTRDRGGPPYSEEDQVFLQALADRAALAIVNVRLFENVREGRERLQALSQRLVEAQEGERRLIARELHDEVGQWLTGLQLTLAMAERAAAGPTRKHIGEAQALANEVLRRVRDLSLTVRPALLDDLGLLPTLQWHSERYTAQTGVRVTVQHTGVEERRFPGALETAAYRIVQEALTNIARHAQTGEATVRLWADAERLGVQVEDRGAGFDPRAEPAAGSSGGLAGMRERTALLGGHFTLESAPGQGTRVTAELPLEGTLERRRGRGGMPREP